MLLKLRRKRLQPPQRAAAKPGPRKARKLLIRKGIYQPDTASSPPQLLPLTCTLLCGELWGEVCRAEKSLIVDGFAAQVKLIQARTRP